MSQRAVADATGSPGLYKLLATGISRVTKRVRPSVSTNGSLAFSAMPVKGNTQAAESAATGESSPSQLQEQQDGEISREASAAPDPQSPAAKRHSMSPSTEPSRQQHEEPVNAVQEPSSMPFQIPENQMQLAQPFNSLSWPSQALKAAEQRPCPVKRTSTDILDVIDRQLSAPKRRRIEPPAAASTSGQFAMHSSQPSGSMQISAAAHHPAVVHASRGLASWQSPTGKSPFKRHIAPPPASRFSRPASAPFTAGRAPVASPAPASGRATRTKTKHDSGLQQPLAASHRPSVSPIQPSSLPIPTTSQQSFRLGQTDAQPSNSDPLTLPMAADTRQWTLNAEPINQLTQPAVPSAWTPMKASQAKLAPAFADSPRVDDRKPAPSSLLAAGLHAKPAAGTPATARARRFQGRAPSAQKRKAVELEAPETQLDDEAPETQRRAKQARKENADVTNTAAVQPVGAFPPPTAVLGFSPHPFMRSDQHKSDAMVTGGIQARTRSHSPEFDGGGAQQQIEPPQHPPQATDSKAKDYGAPWAAAAAADKHKAAATKAQTDSATQPTSNTPPTSAQQPSEALEPKARLFNASLSAPSPFTAAPSKPFGLFNSMSSQSAPFQGFGAFSSASPAALTPPATVAASTPAHSAAKSTPKPAELSSLPAFPSVVFPPPQQPAAAKPIFSFGASQAQPSSEVSQDLPQATQTEQIAVKSVPDKPNGAPQGSDRAQSVSSDVSGETAVDEQLYPFSNQRSAQDRLEGLVDAHHQAADDVEGLYVFGRTAGQSQHEHADSQDLPVTPVQNGIPTNAEADRLQALAMAVPLPSPTPSISPDLKHSETDLSRERATPPHIPGAETETATASRLDDSGAETQRATASGLDNSGAETQRTTASRLGNSGAETQGAAASGLDYSGAETQRTTASRLGNSGAETQRATASRLDSNAAVSASVDEEADDVGDGATTHVHSETEDADAATIVLSSDSQASSSSAKSHDSSGSSSSDSEDASSVGTTSDEDNADADAEAATPVLHPFHAEEEGEGTPGTQPAAAGGWGIDFLKANQSTAKAATDAAADVDKAEAQQALASATGIPSTPPAAAGGWGADLLQANQLAAKAAADAAADVDKAEAQQKSASAQSVPSTQPAAAGSWGVNFLKANPSAADSAAREAQGVAKQQEGPKPLFGFPQASVGLPMPAFQAALAVPLPHFDSPPPSSQPAPVSQTTPIYHPSSNTLSASSTQPKSMTETAPISQPGESASQPLTDAQPAEPVQPTTFEQSALAGPALKQRRSVKVRKK